MSHGHPDAEDLCHDVLLRMRERYDQFASDEDASRYTRRAIANAVIDRQRRQTREHRVAGRVGVRENIDPPC